MENLMSPVQDERRNGSLGDREADGHHMAGSGTIADDSVAAAVREDGAMPRLLLIEDDKETADEIRAELGDHGFEVDWAANGIEGLDKARSGFADAMIV